MLSNVFLLFSLHRANILFCASQAKVRKEFKRTTAKMLLSRELYGRVIISAKGKYNFREECTKRLLSEPMVSSSNQKDIIVFLANLSYYFPSCVNTSKCACIPMAWTWVQFWNGKFPVKFQNHINLYPKRICESVKCNLL